MYLVCLIFLWDQIQSTFISLSIVVESWNIFLGFALLFFHKYTTSIQVLTIKTASVVKEKIP